MKILIACEESQAVCKEMRRLGHECYSCDIIECSGGHPGWHIMQDVIPLLNGNCTFKTMDGIQHTIDEKWDMIIAFPPCTDLAVSGAAWFEQKRKDGRQQKSIDFFLNFTSLDCSRVAIENPVGIMSTYYRKPDQIIHPWQYGHPEQKSTCLWLKGLPKLISTNDVRDEMNLLPKCKRERIHYMSPGLERAKLRSKTFPGIARAMAEQWAGQAQKGDNNANQYMSMLQSGICGEI